MPEDFESGAIQHALVFAIPGPRNLSPDPQELVSTEYVSPASVTETDYFSTNPNAMIMGQRIRLKDTLVDEDGEQIDEAQYAPATRILLQALRDYGAYLVDNAGGFVFAAEDVHTGLLDVTDDRVNELIGAAEGSALAADKTRWQIVMETVALDLDVMPIPIAAGPWEDDEDPALAQVDHYNFELVDQANPGGGAGGDYDGDGRSDMVWRNSSDGRNIIWFMDGAERTSARLIQTIPDPWILGGDADFNGDGTTDLLWRHSTDGRNLIWFFEDGSRSESALAPSVVDLTWTIAATPDLDGDGKSDILWRLPDGRNIAWFMDGATRRDALLLHAIDVAWELGGTGDFDGDGNDDLLWHNTEDYRNIVWLMGLTGRQQAKLIHSSTLMLAGVADFDADGIDDVLWRDTNDGRNILWFMASGERASYALIPSVTDLTWRVAALKDFDGDGEADIHWRTDDGRNIIWFMAGAVRSDAALTFSVTDSQWTLVSD